MWEKRIKSEHPGGCEASLLCALSQSTSCRMLGKIYFLDLGAFVRCHGPGPHASASSPRIVTVDATAASWA